MQAGVLTAAKQNGPAQLVPSYHTSQLPIHCTRVAHLNEHRQSPAVHYLLLVLLVLEGKRAQCAC